MLISIEYVILYAVINKTGEKFDIIYIRGEVRSLHKYLRAIGFSELKDRVKLKEILTDAIMNSDRRAYTMNTENIMLGEFCKDFAADIGIAVCGEFDEEDKFIYDYYYP